jgi:hypothetical protein
MLNIHSYDLESYRQAIELSYAEMILHITPYVQDPESNAMNCFNGILSNAQKCILSRLREAPSVSLGQVSVSSRALDSTSSDITQMSEIMSGSIKENIYTLFRDDYRFSVKTQEGSLIIEVAEPSSSFK